MSHSFKVSKSEDNIMVKDFLSHKGVSKRLMIKLKRIFGGIKCNGVHIRTIDYLHSGDVVEILGAEDTPLEPNASLNVEVLYEDDDLVVFNKPPFMPCHPSIKHQGDTLGNYFSWYTNGCTFRCINRLDSGTSGCCLVAKNQYAASCLQKSYDKIYYAVCCGIPQKIGTINAPIARENDSIILRCVREDGENAVTHYKLIEANSKYSLTEITLETGRTHQIRVHFAYMGHALAGDFMYGGDCTDIDRQALHCGKITFEHPITNQKIDVSAPLPEDIQNLIKK